MLPYFKLQVIFLLSLSRGSLEELLLACDVRMQLLLLHVELLHSGKDFNHFHSSSMRKLFSLNSLVLKKTVLY